jgi:pimeloyl-ACP methyl ester carboxylesterase
LIQEMKDRGRLIAVDIRGQGESSSEFPSFSALAVAMDTIAFMDEKKLTSVTLIGSSLSAASAVYIGAMRPDTVNKIVLSGPFVRDHELVWGLKILIWLGFRKPWGPNLWRNTYKDLHVTIKPDDLEEQSERIYSYLLLDKRMEILREYLFSSKIGCEEKLDFIEVPVMIVMGGKDPDFENPKDELDWIGNKTGGKKYLFPDSGHYPHREEPKRFSELLQ